MKVEFIVARDDSTWNTTIIDVPDEVTKGIASHDPRWDAAIIGWAYDEPGTTSLYGDVVYWGIYNSDPEQK